MENKWGFDFQKSVPSFSFLFFSSALLNLLLSGVCGRLEGERVVGRHIDGNSYRYREEPLPSQYEDESADVSSNSSSTSAMTTSTIDTSAWEPVTDWKDTLSRVINSHDIRIRVEIVIGPVG